MGEKDSISYAYNKIDNKYNWKKLPPNTIESLVVKDDIHRYIPYGVSSLRHQCIDWNR